MEVSLIFKIAAVGILITILGQVLKHSGRDEHAFLISLAGLILVLSWIVPYIYELFETIQKLFALFILLVGFMIALKVMGILDGILTEIEGWSTLLQENVVYVNLLLKLLGITYICEFASNICKDAGYGTLSSHVELFGKVIIMVSGLPVIKTMICMLEEMLH